MRKGWRQIQNFHTAVEYKPVCEAEAGCSVGGVRDWQVFWPRLYHGCSESRGYGHDGVKEWNTTSALAKYLLESSRKLARIGYLEARVE